MSSSGENPSSQSKKVMELKEGDQGVVIKGRVLETRESRVIETKRGPRTISEAILGDDTGRVKVTLWGEKAGSLQEGEVVEIKGAWTSSFRGKVQLNVGYRTQVEKVDDSEAPPAEEVPEDEPTASYRPRHGQGGGGGYRRRF